MAIKKVILEKKKEVKYPEFNSNKIYINYIASDLIYKLSEYDGKFKFARISNGTDSGLTEFNTFFEAINNKNIYILDTQEDLARFIMGCREFPKVEPIEQDIIADDEVSVKDVVSGKIYAYLTGYNSDIYKLNFVGDKRARFAPAYNSCWDSTTVIKDDIEQTIKETIKLTNRTVYQFDTQKEFLQWSLEQIS